MRTKRSYKKRQKRLDDILKQKEQEINAQIEAYLDKPTHCLVCGGYDITGSSINIECGVATQKITCSYCGSSWTDLYKIKRIVDVSIGENK